MAQTSQEEIKTNQQGIDISPMLKDVNRVLHMHLTNLLNPVLNERQNIREILKNMPFVKNLLHENELLKRTNSGLNMDINTVKSYYENIVKEKESIIQEMAMKLEQLEKGTVRLEVKEKNDENKEEFNPEISYSENTKITENHLTMANNNNLGRFMSLMSDNDEDDTEYEDEEDDEDDEDDEDEEDQEHHEDKENKLNNQGADEHEEDKEDEEDEEDTVNPFPFDSTAGINFAHGINTIDILKAPYVWSTLCKYAPKNVREAYPDLNWEITNRYKKETNNDKSQINVEITSNGTIEYEDDTSYKYSSDEDAMEVEDVEIDGVTYLTSDKINGDIYKLDNDGDILEDENGDYVKAGYFKDGISFFI